MVEIHSLILIENLVMADIDAVSQFSEMDVQIVLYMMRTLHTVITVGLSLMSVCATRVLMLHTHIGIL